MASAWGDAWGSAWGDAWGLISIPDTNWWPLVGGAIDRRKYEKEAPEALPIIEAIAKEHPKAPVKELRETLKRYDIAYKESYKAMLKTIIQAKKQAEEDDDEQAILMLL